MKNTSTSEKLAQKYQDFEKNFYCNLSLKCKISPIWLVETACIFLIFLIATAQISMECEIQRWDIQSIWVHTNLKHTYVGIG